MALTDKLTAIADAIRGKTGKSDSMTLDQMPTEIAGIQAGGSGENPLDYAQTIKQFCYGQTLSEPTDIEISFANKVSGIASDALNNSFGRCNNLRSIKISCGISGTVSMASFTEFNGNDTTLESVDLTGLLGVVKPTNITRIFYCRTALREVLGEFDLSVCEAISVPFTRCYALETIRFKAGTIKLSLYIDNSSNLTDDSIQSIIDGLADLTGGTAQTLTLHATVGAKLTDAQKSAASAKNWTISY